MTPIRSATQLLRDAADDLKSSSIAIGTVLVPTLVAYALFGALIMGLAIEQSGVLTGAANGGNEPLWLKGMQIVGQLIGVAVHVLILQVLNGCAFHKQASTSLPRHLSQAFPLLIPALWVSLLYALAVVGGLIALIVPGVIFSMWYFFSMTALVVDGTWGTASLRASHALVKGRFWPVATRVGVIASVGLILSFLVAILSIVLVGAGTAAMSATLPPLSIIAMGTFAYLFFSSLVSIYPTYALLLLYYELKNTPPAALCPDTSNS